MPKKPICIASRTKLLKPIHDSLICNTKIAKTVEAFGFQPASICNDLPPNIARENPGMIDA
jgi:hypothetical protein